MEALITGLFKTGAPWGILCAVLCAIVVAQWKHSLVLSKQLYDLGLKQTEAFMHVREQMRVVEREVTELRRAKHDDR